VILVDANLLVYAHVRSFEVHARARSWLDEQLSSQLRVGLPWPSLLSFLRLVTNPRVFKRPIRMPEAWQQVRAWLACESTWIPLPGDRHDEILGALLATPGVQANLVPDAHLAALAIEHGLTVCSADGAFGQFSGLRWENPLAR
jgi:hypothetical protein